jgi:hypothetical protein
MNKLTEVCCSVMVSCPARDVLNWLEICVSYVQTEESAET